MEEGLGEQKEMKVGEEQKLTIRVGKTGGKQQSCATVNEARRGGGGVGGNPAELKRWEG